MKEVGVQILSQMAERDEVFCFSESGIIFNSAKDFCPVGSRGGVQLAVRQNQWTHGDKDIHTLEIVLEVSDLYTVRVHKTTGETMESNRVSICRDADKYLMEVLYAMFYRKGVY